MHPNSIVESTCRIPVRLSCATTATSTNYSMTSRATLAVEAGIATDAAHAKLSELRSTLSKTGRLITLPVIREGSLYGSRYKS